MVKINDQIPDFVALDQNGNSVNSKDFYGKKWVIYFYPKDMTPGCTVQACNIRDHFAELKKHHISIFGVSMDSSEKHKKFIEKYELPFPLIVDSEKNLIEMFGVWGQKSFLGKKYNGIFRKTFLINEENKLVHIIEKPKVKEHVKEILENFGFK